MLMHLVGMIADSEQAGATSTRVGRRRRRSPPRVRRCRTSPCSAHRRPRHESRRVTHDSDPRPTGWRRPPPGRSRESRSALPHRNSVVLACDSSTTPGRRPLVRQSPWTKTPDQQPNASGPPGVGVNATGCSHQWTRSSRRRVAPGDRPVDRGGGIVLEEDMPSPAVPHECVGVVDPAPARAQMEAGSTCCAGPDPGVLDPGHLSGDFPR